jgi:hypothetical protein
MIKKLLFILSIVLAGTLSAQTFQLSDSMDVNIGGTNYWAYNDAVSLSLVKFHVQNLTGTSATYTCDVQAISNPTGSDLQVCYGQDCRVADGGLTTLQVIGGSNTVVGGGIDNTFKVAPFSFAWVPGDSATWYVKIWNTQNPNDSASAFITYKVNPLSVVEYSVSNVSINSYPNPATDNLTIDYAIEGNPDRAVIDVYDVLGQVVSTHTLNNNNGRLRLNVEKMNAGVYFYAIKVNGQTIKTERVLIK